MPGRTGRRAARRWPDTRPLSSRAPRRSSARRRASVGSWLLPSSEHLRVAVELALGRHVAGLDAGDQIDVTDRFNPRSRPTLLALRPAATALDPAARPRGVDDRDHRSGRATGAAHDHVARQPTDLFEPRPRLIEHRRHALLVGGLRVSPPVPPY